MVNDKVVKKGGDNKEEIRYAEILIFAADSGRDRQMPEVNQEEGLIDRNESS